MRDDDDLTTEPPHPDDAPPRFGGGRIRHLSIDVLSLHVDRALDPEGHVVAEGHLSVCPDCLKDFGELRMTVVLLSRLPQYQPRRSFLLAPEYGAAKSRPLPADPVGAPGASAPPAQRGWSGRLLPGAHGLRIATAVAGIAFVATVAGDLAMPDPAVQRAAVGPSAATTAIGIRATVPAAAQPLAAAPAAQGQAGTEAPSAAAADPATVAAQPDAVSVDGRPSPWRIAQLAAGMVLLWLLVSLAGRAWLDRHERLPG